MTPQQVKDLINQEIVTNNNNDITALVLNPVLIALADLLSSMVGNDLNDLNTSDKTNVINAINELNQQIQNILNKPLPIIVPEESVEGKRFVGDVAGFFALDMDVYSCWVLTLTADTLIEEINRPDNELNKSGNALRNGRFCINLTSALGKGGRKC